MKPKWYTIKIAFRVITLDWDNITWSEAEKRLKFIETDNKIRKDIKKIKVYSSPRLDGYHVYLIFDFDRWFYDWNEILLLRRRYKDDGTRIEIDCQKTNPATMQIMFESKKDDPNRWKNSKHYEHKEKLICEYWCKNFEFPADLRWLT